VTTIAGTQTNFTMPKCLNDPFTATFSARFSIANATSYFQDAFTAADCGGSAVVNSQFSFCECVKRPLRDNTWYRVQAYDRVANPCGNPFSSPITPPSCGASPLPACCAGATHPAPCLAPALLAPAVLLLLLLLALLM
jgi:hypothetical protein